VFGSDTHWNFWIKTNTVDNVLDTRAAMLVCSGKGNPGNENYRSSPGKAIPQRGLIHTGVVGVGMEYKPSSLQSLLHTVFL